MPPRLETRANQRGDLVDVDALEASVVVARRPPLIERTDARAAGVAGVNHVRAGRQRSIAVRDLRTEEDDYVDPCQRREVGRSRIVRDQHLSEIEQTQ